MDTKIINCILWTPEVFKYILLQECHVHQYVSYGKCCDFTIDVFAVSFFIKYILLLSKNNTELKIACLISNNNYFILLKCMTVTQHLSSWMLQAKIIMQTNQWSSTALPKPTYSQKSYIQILQLIFIVGLPITLWY